MKQKLYIVLISSLLLINFGLVQTAFAAASISTPATANVSADSVNAASVALPNIVVTEGAIADIATGLHTWTLPSGFIFDQTSVANVVYTGTTLAGTAVVSFPSGTTMTVNITAASTVAGSMTIGSVTPIKVKATSGSSFASGNITMTGGAIAGLTSSSNFGTLSEVAGAATQLVFTTQPPTSVIMAAPFAAFVVSVEDQFGNIRTADSATSITLASVLGSNNNTNTGALQGTLTRTVSSGSAIFTSLSYPSVDGIQLKATASGLPASFSNVVNVYSQAASNAPPSSAITAPTSGTLVGVGTTVTISGTSHRVFNDVSNAVQNVQLSFDGGTTWVNTTSTNEGFTTWFYAWTVPNPNGAVIIKSRAYDFGNRTETPSAGITVTVTGGTTTPPVIPPVTPPIVTAHSAGSVVLSSDGTIWFITSDGQKRAFTSGGAYLSYGFLTSGCVSTNLFCLVVSANSADIALPAGSFIPPQDGKIICSDRGTDQGTCYLISGGYKAGFVSAAVFTAQGFSFSRATSGDVSWMTGIANISNGSAAHLPGVLINNNGTIQLVGSVSLMGIPSASVFQSWGYSFEDVVTANAADKVVAQNGIMLSHTAGQLSP